MYSLMNVGKNYFCHLHAEQVLAEVMDEGNDQQKKGLLEETISLSIMKCILQESLSCVRIFLDTTGVLYLEPTVLDTLLDTTRVLLKSENEVYFLGCSEEIKEVLKKRYQTSGYEVREQFSMGKFLYLEIGMSLYSHIELTGEQCFKILYEIHADNLRILVADGSKGKSLDLKRLLEDGEDCVYYYFYRLAQRMVEEKLVHTEPSRNQEIFLAAGNDAGYYLARELSRILGTNVCTEKNIVVKPGDNNKYIIVRDVIHMFCELNRLTTLIEGKGGFVSGASCLIDINTGVGSRKNRVSFYTIDLEKGISYRLRNKKKEE